MWDLMCVDRTLPYKVRELFPCLELLEDALADLDFCIDHTLLQALTSHEPPSFDELYHYGLEDLDLKNSWVAYLVLLEKEGEPGCAYFGSTTSSQGAACRLHDYERIDDSGYMPGNISSVMMKKVLSGYVITSIQPVGAMSIPDIETESGEYEYNAGRAITVCVEATLTTSMWTLRSSTCGSVTGYNLWNLESLNWEGLNTHTGMVDMRAVRDVHLDLQGLRADIVERSQRRLEQAQLRNAKRRTPDIRAHCTELRRIWKLTLSPEKREAIRFKDRRANMSERRRSNKRAAERMENMTESRKAIKRARNAAQNVRRRGDKVLVCEGCPDNFRSGESKVLDGHRVVCLKRRASGFYDKPRPFVCEGCPKSYRTDREDALTRHRLTCLKKRTQS
jgi:hypothetical protein